MYKATLSVYVDFERRALSNHMEYWTAQTSCTQFIFATKGPNCYRQSLVRLPQIVNAAKYPRMISKPGWSVKVPWPAYTKYLPMRPNFCPTTRSPTRVLALLVFTQQSYSHHVGVRRPSVRRPLIKVSCKPLPGSRTKFVGSLLPAISPNHLFSILRKLPVGVKNCQNAPHPPVFIRSEPNFMIIKVVMKDIRFWMFWLSVKN